MSRTWFELDDKCLNSHSLAVRLIDLAIQRGANRDTLLRGTGIFYQDLQHSPIKLSPQQLFKLIANAQKQVTSHDLSFLLGRRLFPSNLGIASQLLSNARHFNDMLRMVQCFQSIIFPYLHVRVERLSTRSLNTGLSENAHSNKVCQHRDFHHKNAQQNSAHYDKTYLLISTAMAESNKDDTTRFFIEMLCAAIHSTFKWQLGQSVPIHFYFRFPRPRNIYQYEENLGYRLHFNQPLQMIAIDNSYLTQPMPDSSELVRKQQRAVCIQARDSQPFQTGLLQHVRACIQQLPSGSLEEVAEHMQISPATLKRKLKQHGSQFQKLQDQVKMQCALFDLIVRDLGNKEVAQNVGFSDLANFRRAFKRWTGMTPSEVRG